MLRRKKKRRSPAPLAALAFAAVTGLAAWFGARASPGAKPAAKRWLNELDKPPFQPPPWLFGPVWSLLYLLIAASGWQVFRSEHGSDRDRALLLWAGQMGLNSAWTWLFFAKRRPALALVDCMLLFLVTAAYAGESRKVSRLASDLSLPYLGWLAFATVLNAELLRRNPEESTHLLPVIRQIAGREASSPPA